MKNIQLNDKTNTGVLPPEVRPLDYIAGVETGITYEVRLDGGDWEQFLSTQEKQYREGGFDTQSCTNFDTLKVIQTQINWLLANKKIPQDKLMLMQNLGYFDIDGKVNFSEAFNAITSGTTSQGNYLQNPPEAVRKFGLLPQKDFITPENCSSFDDWIDPSRITPEMYAKAKRFLEIFDVKYEWVVTGQEGQEEVFMKHLKQAPISTCVGTCDVWGIQEDVVLKACPQKQANHAIALIAMKKGEYKKISDQYIPFIKKLGWDFYVLWGLKIVVTVKEAPKPVQPVKYFFPRNLKEGDKGYDVAMLQKILQIEVPEVFNLKAVTDFFGIRTKAGVYALQAKYKNEVLVPAGVTSPTGNFGEFTRAFINKKYSN